MIVNFDAPIRGLDGNPVMQAGSVITLRIVSQAALIEVQVPEDANMQPGQKADYFRLAMLANGSSVDIGIDDVVMLKSRIEQVMTPLVVGRVRELLDPATSTNAA